MHADAARLGRGVQLIDRIRGQGRDVRQRQRREEGQQAQQQQFLHDEFSVIHLMYSSEPAVIVSAITSGTLAGCSRLMAVRTASKRAALVLITSRHSAAFSILPSHR